MFWISRLLLFWWFLFLSNFTVFLEAAREPPSVNIPEQGQLIGMYMKMFRIQRIVAYLGVPYANPPTIRFSPPVVDGMPPFPGGTRNATEFQAECWSSARKPIKQHDEAFLRLIGISRKWDPGLYSEDCLYMNIYIPDGKFHFCYLLMASVLKNVPQFRAFKEHWVKL